MMTKRFPMSAALALACAAAACTPAAPTGSESEPEGVAVPSDAATPGTAAPSHAEWAGKWTGVEGMFVEIIPSNDGGYALTMQSDLDTLGTYAGQDTAEGIAFERGGEQLVLKPATGDQTGLKYLAGKTDCLMVAEGEGYCRD